MPRRDGTGPNGLGQMTGRGSGWCSANEAPGFGNPPQGAWFRGWGGFGGRGRGYGRGRGAGRGNPPFEYQDFGGARSDAQFAPAPGEPAMTPEKEMEMLERQVMFFKQALGELNDRIVEINASLKKEQKE